MQLLALHDHCLHQVVDGQAVELQPLAMLQPPQSRLLAPELLVALYSQNGGSLADTVCHVDE
jgi:hypothetical protein